MATIANLAVQLTASTGGFNAGMRTAAAATGTTKKSVSGLQSVVSQLPGPLGRVGGMLSGSASGGMLAFAAAATAAYAALRLVRRGIHELEEQAEKVDKLAKNSRKLGINIGALQVLHRAAELSGVAVEQLDKGIEKMVVNISKAADGTGEAQQALDGLGLSASQLNKMAPDEQFITVAAAMAKVENQADKVRIAYELFGKSGVDLINTLDMGGAGLREVKGRMQQLGATISALDASKIEKMNDAFGDLRAAGEGLAMRVLARMAPDLERIAHGLADMVGWINELIDNSPDLVNSVVIPLHLVAQAIEGIGKVVAPVAVEEITRGAKDAEAAWKKARLAAQDEADEIREATAAAREHEEQMRRMESAAKRWFDQTRTPWEEYRSSLAEVNELLEAGKVDSETYARAVMRINEELDRQREALTEVEDKAKAVAAAQRGASGAILPRLLLAGSQEGFRAIGEHGGTNGIPALVKIGDKQLNVSKEMRDDLKLIARLAGAEVVADF